MKNISLTIEQDVKPLKTLPTIENFEILDIGDTEWYGSFESENELKIGQEINLDLDNYHGKAIITEKEKDGKKYNYVGNGKLIIT